MVNYVKGSFWVKEIYTGMIRLIQLQN